MPEIAEVETVRRTLKRSILNKEISKVDIYYPQMILSSIDEFKDKLLHNKFKDIKRMGKWLIFELDDYYLLSHLRMEGKYFIKSDNEPLNKHEHVVFTFSDGTTLRYHDTRKFGRMRLVKKDDLYNTEEIKKLGYEPLSKELTSNYLFNRLYTKKDTIKESLLDQSIISGLGNIYADEVLFKSKISPLRISNTITLDECNNIIISSNNIIKKAIECGGCTIRSYTSSLGVIGHYQDYLCCHTRKVCPICNGKITKIRVGGRGTYYCTNCQK